VPCLDTGCLLKLSYPEPNSASVAAAAHGGGRRRATFLPKPRAKCAAKSSPPPSVVGCHGARTMAGLWKEYDGQKAAAPK